ncbi:MAG: hydrogenase formation protein HypD [Hyphomicrobium sp.]|uniref:hydrogenase formation protein HypD n=1 Tax=Hyphomicrobium sp. TaxID=82 RepID=UPI0013212B9D|nr:hydrogenase formation protein HypD [Hyphomicrobium sp.]KAB2941960.1 MAG: hydrogenase formation protein HypD [Hyphomicrobium sp.]MBZ0211666.1 hydrogenase formation protein HypD [Hyphomicrobium sp.]
MKYVDEFRNGDLAKRLGATIAREAGAERTYHIMEFCGGHTHAIFRYGVQDLMPSNVHFVHGPGCPVCVLPMGRIDNAIELAERHGAIVCSYGDMMRVPASERRSLIKAKAAGADIRMVYSIRDALRIARETPDKDVVFFAIGFETTTPPSAVAIREAKAQRLGNFSVFCNHVLTPPAIQHILQSPEVRELGSVEIDGFLGPSHVSSIIGSRPYEYFAEEFQRPVVIAGFEPLDVMQATLMVIRQLNEGRHEVENEYVRVVTREGNVKAQRLVAEVFELRQSFEWRGLGEVPYSALRIKDAYADFDAEKRFSVTTRKVRDAKSCECPSILRGAKKPTDCKLFGTACTPENPIGSCMVSSEGACAAYWTYGRFRGTGADMASTRAQKEAAA